MESFDSEKYSVALFLIEVLKYIDSWNLPPHNQSGGMMTHGVAPSLQGVASIVDYVLSQPKVRDLFRNITKVHADQLLTAVIASIRRPNNFSCVVTKEVLTRLTAHICFCKGTLLSNE